MAKGQSGLTRYKGDQNPQFPVRRENGGELGNSGNDSVLQKRRLRTVGSVGRNDRQEVTLDVFSL